MGNGDLLRHALQTGNFLVALWVVSQQRWLTNFLNASLRLTSWAVVALGVSLITFTVVILTRNVVPVLTTPGTLPYVLLQGLVLFISFNIYMSYVCSMTFSRRIGKAPPEYRYRDLLATRPGASLHDDSDYSEEDSDEDRKSGHAEGDDSLADARAQEMSTVACDAPPPQHVCYSLRNDRITPESPFVSAHGTSFLPRVPLPAVSDDSHEWRRPRPSTGAVGIDADHLVEGKGRSGDRAAAETVLLSQQHHDVAGRRGGIRLRIAGLISRSRCGSALFPRCGHFFAHLLSRRSGEAHLATLLELEAIAGIAERYPARLRAVRLLDAPRRYCHHCRRLKAPREHHCTICNECVTKMDHHCPWINNCVDAENQRYFVLFVWWLWLGTLLASTFIAYGYVRQSNSVHRVRRLHAQWRGSPNKAAVEAELRSQRMPYGPSGVLLTSHLTVLTLCMTAMMCLCMSFFLWFNRRLVLENTTAIERTPVDEMRERVYGAVGFTYRSPYDLGAWLNFIDLFSPARDPFVKMLQKAEAEADGRVAASRRCGLAGDRGQRWRGAAKRVALRLSMVLWLTCFPTLRPIPGDGVHYLTFDSLVSGEPHPLIAA
ncbi:hypothetical protein JKF63_05127 [Porcisia hertigi]|uniref:Palmitoyltransferase n=1 Tax=Porcisia hertigi TaxID=2761500 RepID=A0A836LB62_9TRYP|nr:hypothetical protein JKF63_05127 [Porcisia hertigi]